MGLAAIDSGLKSHEAGYAGSLHNWEDRAIGRIAKRIRSVTVEKIISEGLGITGSVPELINDLLNRRMQIANFGRGQLNEELKRQSR